VALAASVVEAALHDRGAVEVAGLGDHPLHGALLPDDERVRPRRRPGNCSIVNALSERSGSAGRAGEAERLVDPRANGHFISYGHALTTVPAMACRDSTMNGCGLVPGWWTTRPNTRPVALFIKGQGPCDVMTCGEVPLFTYSEYGAVGPIM
jgi:hypothetical protein